MNVFIPQVLSSRARYSSHALLGSHARAVLLCGFVVAGLVGSGNGQVITIDSHGHPENGSKAATVDRRFAQIVPTHVPLSNEPLDTKTRLALVRIMQSEQGFAMRPFPKGHKGLTLVANGDLEPAGEAYLNMTTAEGTCAKPGDRVVITDIKIDHNRIIFMLNGGPDAKHRFLRHIQLGTGDVMNPVVQGTDADPTGARLTLAFKERMPELTGTEVKSLLAPLISFDVKTPIQAYTDTLPPALKKAILDHQVMVGMSIDMVLFALGPPENKIREMDGQMPFEEWIYGKPPQPVHFVRINGNRVIRVEVAKVGETPEIFTKNEVEGLMRTDGTPLEADNHKRTIQLGDTVPDADTQAAAAPPSLRKDGEALPQDDPRSSTGAMRPVQFPTHPDNSPADASNLPRTPASDTDSTEGPAKGTQTPATSAPAQQSPSPTQPPAQPPASQP